MSSNLGRRQREPLDLYKLYKDASLQVWDGSSDIVSNWIVSSTAQHVDSKKKSQGIQQ